MIKTDFICHLNTFINQLILKMCHLIISIVEKCFKISDASSSNEAVHLQQRLKSLSTELVTLRNRLHVSGTASTGATSSLLSTSPKITNTLPAANKNNVNLSKFLIDS